MLDVLTRSVGLSIGFRNSPLPARLMKLAEVADDQVTLEDAELGVRQYVPITAILSVHESLLEPSELAAQVGTGKRATLQRVMVSVVAAGLPELPSPLGRDSGTWVGVSTSIE